MLVNSQSLSFLTKAIFAATSGGICIMVIRLWLCKTTCIISTCFKKQVDQVAEAHSHLPDLENPQVELQFLRSCLFICKINHLLRSVIPGITNSPLSTFDEGL